MSDGSDDRPEAAGGRGRAKLWDIDTRLHCSIVGTCLTLGDLRRIASHLNLDPLRGATDFQVHGSFCIAAAKPGPVAKQMQKMLDRRYRLAVRRFAGVADAAGLTRLWQASLEEGDIPGPYWALMTHPGANDPVRTKAFGDVHMLSHLVGAANRADVRRLVVLEAERNALADALAAAKKRIAEQERGVRRILDGHAVEVRDLSARLATAASMEQQLRAAQDRIAQFERGGSYLQLQDEITCRSEALARSQGEVEQQRSLITSLVAENERLHRTLDGLEGSLRAVAAECDAVEMLLREQLSVGAGSDVDSGSPTDVRIDLCGRRIVYVGGRGGVVPHLRAVVERSGGIFVHHDGGFEEQSSRLDGLLGHSDAVFCPIDCVSHDACLRAKRACKQRATTFVPLRTCSLSSFVEGLRQLSRGGAADPATPGGRSTDT